MGSTSSMASCCISNSFSFSHVSIIGDTSRWRSNLRLIARGLAEIRAGYESSTCISVSGLKKVTPLTIIQIARSRNPGEAFWVSSTSCLAVCLGNYANITVSSGSPGSCNWAIYSFCWHVVVVVVAMVVAIALAIAVISFSI